MAIGAFWLTRPAAGRAGPWAKGISCGAFDPAELMIDKGEEEW